MELFQRHVNSDLPRVYGEVNALLARQGISPARPARGGRIDTSEPFSTFPGRRPELRTGAQSVPQAKRLLAVYQRRLRSNLLAGLRPLAGDRALQIAEGLGALIDGLYLREVLKSGPPDSAAAVKVARDYLVAELKGRVT